MAKNNAAQNGGNRTNWAPVAITAVLATLIFGLAWLFWGPDSDDSGVVLPAPTICTLECGSCGNCGDGIDINVPGTINLNVDVSGTIDLNVDGMIVVEHTGTVVVDHTGTVAVTVITQPPVTPPVEPPPCTSCGGTTTPTTTPSPPTTQPVNHNPSISVSPEFAQKWAESNGEACFTFNASVSDPDGDPLTISWSTGGGGTSTQVCRGVGNAWSISATVSDGRGGLASDGSTFNVTDRAGG